MTELDVLSLYDGCSMARVALERAGIPVKQYYASEIDPYPIKVSQKNYPDIIHVGDVNYVGKTNDSPNFDLLIGGSPCQGFSFASKGRLNFDDPRSKLFFEYVRILKEFKPKYFLFENVRMKQECQDIISEYLGVKPIAINSGLVSAQNRYRLYWTNIPNVTQPDDKGIVLEDIIEMDNPNFKYRKLKEHYPNKVHNEGGCYQVGKADINGHDILKRVYDVKGKSPTLNAMTGGNREPKILCGAWRGRYTDTGSTEQRLEIRANGKTNALTTVQKDNVAIDIDNLRWRALSCLEMERLQTLPDNYTYWCSNTQRKKMIGNGFTVDVIAHILKGIKDE